MTAEPKKQVILELVGINGNAFAILGAFRNAAREQGWTEKEIHDVQYEAMAGDYNHLLATIMENTK